MRIGLVQLTVTDDPAENLPVTVAFIRQAAKDGARFVLTPECTNALSSSRSHQRQMFRHESDDMTVAALSSLASELDIWLLIGSVGLLTTDDDGRFANRSLLIAPDGSIRARYDKIHMFDVNVSKDEVYRESAGYRPGARAVISRVDEVPVGMTICYDIRFPHLYRHLAKGGAQILTVPAAFNDTTGAAHWEPLLRARAIETGCFVLAPAQTGYHSESHGKGRRTHGHSLVVSPWGEVLADGGTKAGVTAVDLNLDQVAQCRHRVPSLTHDRDFEGP